MFDASFILPAFEPHMKPWHIRGARDAIRWPLLHNFPSTPHTHVTFLNST